MQTNHIRRAAGLTRGRSIVLSLMACAILGACTQAANTSAIDRERQKPVQRYDIGQAVASNGKVIVAGTQSGAALVSKDQGKSWTRTALGAASLIDTAACGDGSFVAIDFYHKVWSADADGANWKSVALSQPKTPLAVTCDKQGGWWVSGIRSVIAASRDKGATWKVTDLGEDAQLTSIQFIDDKAGVALGEFGLTAYTEDGGATWQKGAKIPGDFYPYAALFINRQEGWVSGIAGQMMHTTDGGKSWQKQPNLSQAALYRLFLHEGVPYGVGNGGTVARLEGDAWRAMPYPDAVPVFLGGGAPLRGQSAVLIAGPGGLLRAVGTTATQ